MFLFIPSLTSSQAFAFTIHCIYLQPHLYPRELVFGLANVCIFSRHTISKALIVHALFPAEQFLMFPAGLRAHA